jgi:predicted PurR-regulated permease PerM
MWETYVSIALTLVVLIFVILVLSYAGATIISSISNVTTSLPNASTYMQVGANATGLPQPGQWNTSYITLLITILPVAIIVFFIVSLIWSKTR